MGCNNAGHSPHLVLELALLSWQLECAIFWPLNIYILYIYIDLSLFFNRLNKQIYILPLYIYDGREQFAEMSNPHASHAYKKRAWEMQANQYTKAMFMVILFGLYFYTCLFFLSHLSLFIVGDTGGYILFSPMIPFVVHLAPGSLVQMYLSSF